MAIRALISDLGGVIGGSHACQLKWRHDAVGIEIGNQLDAFTRRTVLVASFELFQDVLVHYAVA